eukprot:889932-Rhodomonas_salina.1
MTRAATDTLRAALSSGRLAVRDGGGLHAAGASEGGRPLRAPSRRRTPHAPGPPRVFLTRFRLHHCSLVARCRWCFCDACFARASAWLRSAFCEASGPGLTWGVLLPGAGAQDDRDHCVRAGSNHSLPILRSYAARGTVALVLRQGVVVPGGAIVGAAYGGRSGDSGAGEPLRVGAGVAADAGAGGARVHGVHAGRDAVQGLPVPLLRRAVPGPS